MDKHFDVIVWGSSPRGIERAIALKNSGKKVLLAARFGFPGGKHTESLAAFFGKSLKGEDSLDQRLVSRAAAMPFGVLNQNPSGILLHPESIKRICWEWITKAELPVLFHVLPAGLVKNEQGNVLRLFGREGFFELTAGAIEDHADNIPLSGIHADAHYNMYIHAIFNDPLPLSLPGFNLVRNVETPIGRFVSISLRKVAGRAIDDTFNRELNRLSTEGWSKYRSRIRMIPVYPEIIPVQQ
ncbi:MAG: FAD-dependent oxidoreductase [Bacteroidetes bacterium]|nr:FAD-dependent oxidoreductase [Bacteroidota bacterium]